MPESKIRVMVGADGGEARDLVARAVESQDNTALVGHAENAIKVIAMARTLRPDVVILDCCLPHTVGLEGLHMSRAAGLDAAERITGELPEAQVLLVNNLDSWSKIAALPGSPLGLYEEAGGPLVLGGARHRGSGLPVFARIAARKAGSSYAGWLENVMLFGMGGVLVGLMMMVTGLLFLPGITSVALGMAAVLAGGVGKLASRLSRRSQI